MNKDSQFDKQQRQPSTQWKFWREARVMELEPYYCYWVSHLTSEALHDKADIATVLAILHQQRDDMQADGLRLHKDKMDLWEKVHFPPTDDEIAAYRDLFRSELDKRMDTKHPSASPSTEAHEIALRAFVEGRSKGVARSHVGTSESETWQAYMRVKAALDRAAYALFQLKRFADMPKHAIDFCIEQHAEACKLLDETASASVAPSSIGTPTPREWTWPVNTVGKLIASLQTLPPEMPFYTAYFVEINGERVTRCSNPSLSRETTDGFRIKKFDPSDTSLVMWASLAPFATVPTEEVKLALTELAVLKSPGTESAVEHIATVIERLSGVTTDGGAKNG